jgi:peptide/nickel transport system substrate-binding protein
VYKFQRLLTVGVTLGAVAALSAACGSSPGSPAEAAGAPVRSGTLTVAIPDTIDGWNPDSAVQLATYQLIRQVEAPLLEVSPDGQRIQPGLAASWSYNNARTVLTLHLQPKAAFSDGSPVTAKDVVFSARQWMSGTQYGLLYSTFLKGATAVGKDTVRLELTAPSSALLGILTWSNSAVLPAGFGGKSAKAFYAEPIGAGPFAIESSTDHRIVLTRNPHYWQSGRPYLDSIVYDVVADTSQRLLQVRSGDVGMADRVPTDFLSTVSRPDVVTSVPSSSMSVLTFGKKGPTADVWFRKAVSLAIDRAALVSSVYEKKATVAKGLLPPQVPGDEGCTSCAWSTYDATAAKQALAKAGPDHGPIGLLVDSSRGIDLLAAQAIQPMLQAVGIDVQVQKVDSATLLTRLASGDFSMTIGNYSAQSPTGVDPLSFLAATQYMFTGASTTPVLVAIGGVSAAKGVAGQQAAVAAFEKQNYQNATVVPLLSPYVSSVLGPKTHGLALRPSGLYDASALWVSK